MYLILANIAKRDEILRGVLPAFSVWRYVVRLKVSRVGLVPLFITPSAVSAPVFVPLLDLTAHLVGYRPVVFRCLSRTCRHIGANGKFGHSSDLRHDLPPHLGSEFSNPSCPLGPIVCHIPKFFTGHFRADIL